MLSGVLFTNFWKCLVMERPVYIRVSQTLLTSCLKYSHTSTGTNATVVLPFMPGPQNYPWLVVALFKKFTIDLSLHWGRLERLPHILVPYLGVNALDVWISYLCFIPNIYHNDQDDWMLLRKSILRLIDSLKGTTSWGPGRVYERWVNAEPWRFFPAP